MVLILTKKAEDLSSTFVRVKGLEPPHLAASDPKSDVSTNSTTPAFNNILRTYTCLTPKSSVSTNSTTPAGMKLDAAAKIKRF